MSRRALRAAVFAFTLLSTAYAATELASVLSPKGYTTLGLIAVILFVPCFAWTAFGASFALLGLIAAVRPRWTLAPDRALGEGEITEADRTAILIPIHNESPTRVTANAEVMFRALQARPEGKVFDLFLLSDTTDADIWLAEQEAWQSLCVRLGAFGRVFYRRRAKAEGKKAGNLRDFCLRHGRAYRYLIVLDADSVVTAETMCRLVSRMVANPRVGIIQVPPLPVRCRTIFARWQQFAARVYGPLWAKGEAVLSGPDGNYYGHNAILRTEPFCSHAGLGELPGSGPLAGPISSHDFVEAALVRRAGYEVWLATDLGGSYEQCPTTLIDYAVRDKRWCQGNLQHLRVAMLPGLVGWSRVHFMRGVCSYVIPPLWLLFVGTMLLVAAHDLSYEPSHFLPAHRTLFPLWPIYDFAAAQNLFLLAVAMLFGPRLIAAAMSLRDMLRSRQLPPRRVPMFIVSLLGEWLIGALLTPALMLFQALFVLATLFGERVRWTAQQRNDHQVGLSEALQRHLIHLLVALGLGAASLLVSTRTLLWMLPLLLPMLLSPLFTMATSWAWLGRVADRLGWLQIPEDWSTDEMLTVFDTPDGPKAPKAINVLRDHAACARHALSVVGSGLLQRLPDSRRAELRQRMADELPMDRAATHDCLTDVELLLEALAPKKP